MPSFYPRPRTGGDQGASYQANLTEAERMVGALRRQGDQYLSAEQAGARYRAGLQGEGENLVRLIDYYNRLTDAQRRAEQVSLSAQRVALTSNSDALQRDAVSQGATAADNARLAAQAYAEVTRQLGRAVNEESQEYRDRLALLQDERNIRAEIANAQSLVKQDQQLELIRRETELVGAGVAVRERELALLRERQAILNTPGLDINSDASRQRLANAAAIADATQQLQRQRTAYDELARVGEQAFDRIGSSITQAFANGGMRAISFGNIAKAVFSEVIQASMRLAVINPIVNSVFGGNRATLGGAMSTLDGSSGSVSLTPDGNGGFSLSNVASAASTGRSLFSGGGLGSFFPGGGSINTGVGFLDAGLNATAFGGGAGNIASSVPGAAGDGGALLAHAGGGGATFGQLLGPAAAIGGGIYGMYSGIKKGGIGGYMGAAGGAVSAATGVGMLGAAAGLLPALGALGPIGLALGAALALAGAFMPGKKASGKGQEVSINTLNGDRTAYGLGGSRFSQGNADFAGSLAGNVAGLESALQDQLGFGIDTTIGAGVTSGRKKKDPGSLYLRVGEQRAQFSNDEAGAKAFGETAGRFLLDEFKKASTGQGDKGSIVRNSGSIEELGKNLDWYESTYKALTGIQAKTTEFAESLRTLVKPYDDAIGKAQQLELATDALTKKRGEELEKALEPMLRNGLAAETYSDGLKAVRENYEAVIRVAGELGRSTDDLTAAMGRAGQHGEPGGQSGSIHGGQHGRGADGRAAYPAGRILVSWLCPHPQHHHHAQTHRQRD